MAAGKDKIPSNNSTLLSFFQLTLMGWTDEGVPQLRQLAWNTSLGLANSNATFSVFDPKNDYYHIRALTGEEVPSEDWANRATFRWLSSNTEGYSRTLHYQSNKSRTGLN